MNERQRVSYIGILKFKSLQELQRELADVEAAIKKKVASGITRDYYFKREALRNTIWDKTH